MKQPLTTQFNTTLKQVAILCLAVVSIFMLERVGWARTLQQTTLTVLQPIEYLGMRSASILEFPFYLIDQERKNAAEVSNLKQAYARALARLSELEAVEKENEALRVVIEGDGSTAQGSNANRREKKQLAAPIISYAMTAIALGSADGIQEGALVYISDTLMGRISTVSKNQSQVLLFQTRDSQPVLVQTESGVQGLLVGTGKRVEVTQLPIQAVINPGERLTTVGQPDIPSGQFVGVVATVSKPATAPMQTAVVDQLHSFYAAPLVEVR